MEYILENIREAADNVGEVLEELIKEQQRLTERPDIKAWILARYDKQTKKLTEAVRCLRDTADYIRAVAREYGDNQQ